MNTQPSLRLAGRTGFNEVALEDTFIQGLPQLILFKVYSQMSLPSGLENWKTIVHNLDCLHRGFSKLRQSIRPTQTQTTQVQLPHMQTPMAIHMPAQSLRSKRFGQPLQPKMTSKASWLKP